MNLKPRLYVPRTAQLLVEIELQDSKESKHTYSPYVKTLYGLLDVPYFSLFSISIAYQEKRVSLLRG